MTDPQTPATEAGRRHLDWLNAGDDVFPEDARATVIAIEAEARAAAMIVRQSTVDGAVYAKGRADALREAADAVRALRDFYPGEDVYLSRAAVLAILDPQP